MLSEAAIVLVEFVHVTDVCLCVSAQKLKNTDQKLTYLGTIMWTLKVVRFW